MLGPVARISNQIARNVMKTPVRASHSHGGVPGENLPFNIYNRTRFTINFFLYVATGLGAPYVILWYQLKKNSNNYSCVPKPWKKCDDHHGQEEPFARRYPWREPAFRHYQPLQAHSILHSVLRFGPCCTLSDHPSPTS